MSSRNHKPQWWQLYIIVLVLAGLFVLEIRLGLKGALNIAAQLGILFLAYACMQVWIRANRRALMHLDEESGEWRFKVYELNAADLARAHEAASRLERRPIVRLPQGEVKGVLSTTFEMDEFGHDTPLPVGSKMVEAKHVLNVRETKDIDA